MSKPKYGKCEVEGQPGFGVMEQESFVDCTKCGIEKRKRFLTPEGFCVGGCGGQRGRNVVQALEEVPSDIEYIFRHAKVVAKQIGFRPPGGNEDSMPHYICDVFAELVKKVARKETASGLVQKEPEKPQARLEDLHLLREINKSQQEEILALKNQVRGLEANLEANILPDEMKGKALSIALEGEKEKVDRLLKNLTEIRAQKTALEVQLDGVIKQAKKEADGYLNTIRVKEDDIFGIVKDAASFNVGQELGVFTELSARKFVVGVFYGMLKKIQDAQVKIEEVKRSSGTNKDLEVLSELLQELRMQLLGDLKIPEGKKGLDRSRWIISEITTRLWEQKKFVDSIVELAKKWDPERFQCAVLYSNLLPVRNNVVEIFNHTLAEARHSAEEEIKALATQAYEILGEETPKFSSHREPIEQAFSLLQKKLHVLEEDSAKESSARECLEELGSRAAKLLNDGGLLPEGTLEVEGEWWIHESLNALDAKVRMDHNAETQVALNDEAKSSLESLADRAAGLMSDWNLSPGQVCETGRDWIQAAFDALDSKLREQSISGPDEDRKQALLLLQGENQALRAVLDRIVPLTRLESHPDNREFDDMPGINTPSKMLEKAVKSAEKLSKSFDLLENSTLTYHEKRTARKALRLRQEGLSFQKIADECGMTRNKVRHLCDKFLTRA